MKILLIHNYHRSGSVSGDDIVFNNETELLKQNGVEVLEFAVSNDAFDNAGFLGKLLYTFGMVWSAKNYRAVKAICKREKPDIVHVHTFFPLLSPSVLYAAKRSGCKVVATLHDTRFVCPCATSLRNGIICNECIDGRYGRLFRYNCFKGSRLQSLIVAFVFAFHKKLKTFYTQIDRYICLNDTQVNLLTRAGYDSEKIIKKYNFLPEMSSAAEAENPEKYNLPDKFAVFFGRIGEEKGIKSLMQIWEALPHIPLVIIGRGPMEEELSLWAEAKPDVSFIGALPHEVCLEIVKRAAFVVFPSIWYEGCSMVEVESQSLKKAIVAYDVGFSSEAIENEVTGLKVPLGDTKAFSAAVKRLWDDPGFCSALGENAYAAFEARYTSNITLLKLMDCYKNLLAD